MAVSGYSSFMAVDEAAGHNRTEGLREERRSKREIPFLITRPWERPASTDNAAVIYAFVRTKKMKMKVNTKQVSKL